MNPPTKTGGKNEPNIILYENSLKTIKNNMASVGIFVG